MTINLYGRNAVFGLGDEEIDEDVVETELRGEGDDDRKAQPERDLGRMRLGVEDLEDLDDGSDHAATSVPSD